jgi:hypothetical protein
MYDAMSHVRKELIHNSLDSVTVSIIQAWSGECDRCLLYLHTQSVLQLWPCNAYVSTRTDYIPEHAINMDSTLAVHVYLAEQTLESSDQTLHHNTLLKVNNIPAVHV